MLSVSSHFTILCGVSSRQLSTRRGCFQLLGFDCLLNQNGALSLLEVGICFRFPRFFGCAERRAAHLLSKPCVRVCVRARSIETRICSNTHARSTAFSLASSTTRSRSSQRSTCTWRDVRRVHVTATSGRSFLPQATISSSLTRESRTEHIEHGRAKHRALPPRCRQRIGSTGQWCHTSSLSNSLPVFTKKSGRSLPWCSAWQHAEKLIACL